eukprot:scaffold114206_cov73-Attheya_sp.AAC.3
MIYQLRRGINGTNQKVTNNWMCPALICTYGIGEMVISMNFMNLRQQAAELLGIELGVLAGSTDGTELGRLDGKLDGSTALVDGRMDGTALGGSKAKGKLDGSKLGLSEGTEEGSRLGVFRWLVRGHDVWNFGRAVELLGIELGVLAGSTDGTELRRKVDCNKLGLSEGTEEGARLGCSDGWSEGMMLGMLGGTSISDGTVMGI